MYTNNELANPSAVASSKTIEDSAEGNKSELELESKDNDNELISPVYNSPINKEELARARNAVEVATAKASKGDFLDILGQPRLKQKELKAFLKRTACLVKVLNKLEGTLEDFADNADLF
jgi:hypothetical protein